MRAGFEVWGPVAARPQLGRARERGVGFFRMIHFVVAHQRVGQQVVGPGFSRIDARKSSGRREAPTAFSRFNKLKQLAPLVAAPSMIYRHSARRARHKVKMTCEPRREFGSAPSKGFASCQMTRARVTARVAVIMVRFVLVRVRLDGVMGS